MQQRADDSTVTVPVPNYAEIRMGTFGDIAVHYSSVWATAIFI